MHVRKAMALYKNGKTRMKQACQRKDVFFYDSGRVASECTQSQTDINWDVLDFARRIYGHPQQIGAVTVTNYCDHCQRFPLSDCTWCLCTGVSNRFFLRQV